jgi:2-polyprenyl-6-methoxyphenol hydroxylase-like FAD-dependent oxidoreductase
VRIVCLGGGPAGLYFAIAAALAHRGHEITVLEQDPPGATYGWGVTFGEQLVDAFYAHDPPSAAALHRAAALWQERELRLYGRRVAHFPGYGYGIGRATLLEILTRRAVDLGVEVRHDSRVDDLGALADADLLVAADGARSMVREAHREHFGTRINESANTYVWLGAAHRFPHFTFALERTDAGHVWMHGYPYAEGRSTVVVECSPATRDALGLDSAEGVAVLEQLFAPTLAGGRLLTQSRTETVRWQRFAVVQNLTTVYRNTALLGDAASTMHFSLGRGTRLALADAALLARCLEHAPEVSAALVDYDRRRRAAPHHDQGRAQRSMTWYEQMDVHAALSPLAFANAMSGGPPRAGLRDRLVQTAPLRRMYRRADARALATRMAARNARRPG